MESLPPVPQTRPAPVPAPQTWSSRSQSLTFQTFGQYSQFLRSAVADEETLQVGESLQTMATQAERMIAMLRDPKHDNQRLAQGLLELLDLVRSHRMLLGELGADWHGYYEFSSHFTAVNHLRTRLTQWAQDAAPQRQVAPVLEEFDLVVWRVLGAGALLLDVYEQSCKHSPMAADASPAPWRRVVHWVRRRLRLG